MSTLETTSAIELLAKGWIKAFKKSPWITSIATGIFTFIFTFGIYFIDQADKKHKEAARLQSLDYQTQLKQLNQTQSNIEQLLNFIEMQKRNIRETEDAVLLLKKEQETLKPIVESDKAVVEALFRAQEDRTRASIWRERWIGFAFGVVASLVASFIGFLIRLWIRGRKETRQGY